jgi:subtilase family serine protease
LSQLLRRPGAPALAAVLCMLAFVAAAAAAPAPRAVLAGSAPPWATASNFKASASSSAYVGFRLYLGWRNGAQAEATARAVSDPSSSSYQRYLTPQSFRQQFAPSQADVNTVRNWLAGQGFTVEYTPTNNLYVSAEGTVAQASTAFGVSFGEYDVNGMTLMSPTSDVSVPAALGGIVEDVIGLDQSDQLVHYDHVGTDAPPAAGFRNAQPCSAYWGEKIASDLPSFNGKTFPYAPCGYGPAQLRGAYGLTAANTGAGQTVAIIDAYASPTILQDANTYSARHGLPQFQGNQFSQVVAPGTYNHPEAGLRQDPQGWYGEETLDVEAVHTMAPGANVVFVGSANNFRDLDAALNHVVDRHLAQIVTNSYGYPTELLPSGVIKPVEDILVQAAAEGIGVYFSSGDGGDETQVVGYRTADWPASSPWVTAAGGTSLAVGAANNYLFETGWGTHRYVLSSGSWLDAGWQYGAGGGTSRLFAEPSYQQGVADSFAGYFGGNGRVVPDVSLDGDPNTGMLVGQTQTFSNGTYYDEFRLGGTSLSSPLLAGVMADADQAAGAPHGFANPAFYALAGSSAYRDVVSPKQLTGVVRADYINSESGAVRYTIRLMNQMLSLTVAKGYDDGTGLGSPNGGAFLSALSH